VSDFSALAEISELRGLQRHCDRFERAPSSQYGICNIPTEISLVSYVPVFTCDTALAPNTPAT
jgi:hypothetical protein